ncbi:MAG: peptidylprolyl isomerase [Bdellovibrionales bacterium]
MPNILRIGFAALALGAVALPVLAADTTPPAAAASGDPVVARVNGQEIHRSDVLREMQLLPPQMQNTPMQILYPELLSKMIATKVVAAEGYNEKMQNEQEVKDRLKAAEAQIVAQYYVHKKVEPKVTDAKIKERYDQLATKFKPQEEVHAAHILMPTEGEANEVIKQLKGGADFAKLAQEKSRDTGSSKQGGDLGYFTQDVMVKGFADAAFAMKKGQVSEKPVKTEFGYHVIKVLDKRKSAPPPLADVKDKIASQLGQEMTNDLIKSLEAKAKIEKFNIDGTPMKTAAKADDTAKKK